MISAFVIFGFFIAIAWLQQAFLDRLIKVDLDYLKQLPTHLPTPPPEFHPQDP